MEPTDRASRSGKSETGRQQALARFWHPVLQNTQCYLPAFPLQRLLANGSRPSWRCSGVNALTLVVTLDVVRFVPFHCLGKSIGMGLGFLANFRVLSQVFVESRMLR